MTEITSPKLYDPKEHAKKTSLDLLNSLLRYEGLKKDDLWQLYENHAPREKFQEERNLLNDLTKILIRSNQQISPSLIRLKILYEIIGTIIDYPTHKDEILSKLDETLKNLTKYNAVREIDIPIINLELEGKPFKFGEVNFLPIGEGDRTGIWWDSIKNTLGDSAASNNFLSYGRVYGSGDLDNSTLYTGSVLDETLLLLKGISFPFTIAETVQFGAIGEVSLNRTRYYRLGKPKETIQLEAHSGWIGRLGPPQGPYYLYKDLLSNVDEANLANLLSLVEKEGLNPENVMSSKIIRGLRWVGEATKIDTVQARFAKLTFALENLIGGEAILTSIGLTAMLAERSAFLIGGTTEEKIQTDSDIRKFYGKRSGIVHGGRVEISNEELQRFVSIIRNVAWSLLKLKDKVKSINDLQGWITEQRYS